MDVCCSVLEENCIFLSEGAGEQSLAQTTSEDRPPMMSAQILCCLAKTGTVPLTCPNVVYLVEDHFVGVWECGGRIEQRSPRRLPEVEGATF